MAQLTLKQNQTLEQACKKMLENEEIRFCGVINSLGHLVAGGFKEGVTPHESDGKRRMMYMQLILEVNMRREYNETLGPIEYISSKRGKVLMISVPIFDHLVLISADPNSDAQKIAQTVSSLFRSSSIIVNA
ncbi:MAG: DUF6659 family protein [Nitrosopumilaceae archaeon]